MERLLERSLPAIATWGPAAFAALIALSLIGIWMLGRGGPFLVPARWPARVGSGGLIVLAALLGAGIYGMLGPMRPMLDQVRSITRAVGRPAGDLAYRQVRDDLPRRLSELHDQVVLVNLWATWCPPCRRELPAVDSLQRAYAGRGLVVVTISNEDRDRLREFSAKHPLSTLNVYASRLGWLDVPGRPLSVLIDRGGTVRECMIGARSYSEFERKVTKYLVPRS